MKDVPKIFAVFMILIIVIAIVASTGVVVEPGHRGVAVTLGKMNPEPLGEGFTLKIPGITKVYMIPIQQITQKGTATTFSSDLQTVEVAYSVLYRLPEDKVALLYQQYAGDPFESLVAPRMQDFVKQACAQHKAEAIVKMREEVKAFVLPKLRASVEELINIVDLAITNVDLSDEMERAIEQKQVMEQQAQQKAYELQKAQREAEITVVNAKAEAEAVRIKGEALKASPEVIDLEIVKKWDGHSPQSVVTSQGGANVLLPLKK